MKFLITLVAIFGYASASAIVSPWLVGATPGDIQGAAIDANAAARDTVRAIGEGNARAAEAAILYNTEAVRRVAETNREINENAYWGSVAATQNLVAAAQTQAAAINNAAAAARAGALGVAPLGVAPYGLGAPLGVASLGWPGYGIPAY